MTSRSFLLGQPIILTAPSIMTQPSWAAQTLPPQPLFTPQQQTTSANVSSIFSSTINRPTPPHVQGRIEFYRSSADDNYRSAEEMGRKLEAIQNICLDLENPHINAAKLLQKLKDTIGFISCYKICEEYAHAMTGNRNAQTGERLLHDNFRNILRVKDDDGRNLLEQVAAYYASRNEIYRGRCSLSELGEILEKQADLLEKARGLPLFNQDRNSNNPTASKYYVEAGTLGGQAKDLFESLPAPAKEAVCRRIWELDGKGDKGLDYGRNTIMAGLEKLLSHKGARPIEDALSICGEDLLKGAVIQASYLNTQNIQRNDSRDTVKEIKKLYELEDLQKFLNDPSKRNDFLAGKYLNLSPDLSALLNTAIWIASFKPHALGDFSKNHVCEDVHVLSYIKNQRGDDIISQLMAHQQEKIKAQRLITEIEGFVLNAAQKSSRDEFYRLSWTTQEYLRERVWKRDGGDRDPYFGRPDYGTWKIDTEPNTLYVGNGATHFPAPIDVRVIKDQISKADAALLQDLEAHKVIPAGSVDVSSRTVLENDPGLLDYLPKNLRKVHVTAELSGVASVGGIAPVVKGLVKFEGTKNSRVLMPLYRGDGSPISKAIFDSLKPKPEYDVEVNREKHRVFKANVNGIKVYFIDDPRLFYIPRKKDGSTGDVYKGDYLTVKERWITFQSAASEVLWKFYKKKNPFQLIHLHDAQMGLIPKILASRHPDEWRKGETPATLFTFHNVNDPNTYEGPARKFLAQHGLPERDTNSLVEAIAGPTPADMVNGVSDNYVQEVQGRIHGNGMDPAFKKAALGGRMVGILNGNSDDWDPTKNDQLRTWKSVLDPTLDQTVDLRFGPDSPDLADKIKTIQREICAYLKSLPKGDPAYADLDPEKPIVFYVGRYDYGQKGVDKFKMIMEETLRNGAQFVCVGTEVEEEPDSPSHKMLQDMKNFAKARGNKGILVLEDVRENGRLKYQQNKFGSLLRAACTLAIFPSFFEPCGLVQGELKCFGKLIMATRTGGFVDTVKTEGPDRNGYLFTRCDDWWNDPEQANAIYNTLRIAIHHAHQIQRALYHGDANAQKPHLDLMRTTMHNDLHFTWDETPDGSLSPVEKYDLAGGMAFKNSKKRGLLSADLKILKV